MRAFVFTDRALERQAGRFVWLSVDTEKEANAKFLEQYPIEAYPTLLVIDPQSEQIVLRWVGSATVPQLAKLFDDGERAIAGSAEGADAVLASADRLAGAGKKEEAAAAYRDALAKAPPSWPPRDRVVESLLGLLSQPATAKECVELARAELAKERTPHLANAAGYGLGCALMLEGDAKAPAVAEFETAVRSALGEPRIEMPGDDRAGLLSSLVDAREESGDKEGAKKAAADWLAFLDAEAARAPDARARAVYDSFRLAASIASGDPAHAIPILERSEKDLPGDYNPPARLAIALGETGRYDEAVRAADRALALAYGPRKLRIFSSKAGFLEKKGDKAAARATLEEALRYAEGLPASQVSKRSVDSIRKRIEALG